jgi:hypothetical protein
MDDEIFEGHFFSFSDQTVEHHTHSQEDVLHDVRVNLRFFGLAVDDSIEPGNVFSDKFSLENPGNLRHPFDLGNVVFINLSSDGFEEFFLFPTLVFNFVFYYFSKLPAVLWVG